MSPYELISSADIEKRLSELAPALEEWRAGGDILVLGVLKGAFVFTADLVRKLDPKGWTVDFIVVRSYEGRNSKGDIELLYRPSGELEGKRILLVEDILDTGVTLSRLIRLLRDEYHTGEIKTCVLLDKPSGRKVPFEADFRGFEIPPRFVVGYGLDYEQKYRNLPYIAVFADEGLNKTENN